MTNPLIAQRQDSTTALSGIGIAESAVDLYNGIEGKSWVEAGIGGVGVGLEALSLALDPVGTLLSYGVAWLMEHVKPLSDALDWLAGDADQIAAYAQTWKNVATETGKVAEDFASEVRNGTAGWGGEAGDAYRANAAQQLDKIKAAGTCAESIGSTVQIVGVLVGAVREIVRDLVAECVATLIARIPQWVAEIGGTLGIATPHVVASAAALIARWVNRIKDFIKALTKSLDSLSSLLGKLDEIFAAIKKSLPGSKSPSSTPTSPNTVTSPNAATTTPSGSTSPSTTTSPSGTTTPSGATTPSGSTSPSGTTSPGSTTTPSGTTSPSGTTTPSSTTPSSTTPTPSTTTPSGTSPGKSPSTPDTSPNRPADPNTTKTPERARNTCNDPVDVVTGDVVAGQVDVDLAGVLPLVLRRTHVSSFRAGRSFGPTWASTLDQRLEFDRLGVVYVADDGMVLVYPDVPATGAVMPAAGPRWPLRRTEDGYAIERRGTPEILHFTGTAAEAPLTRIADRNGNHIDIARGADGIATQVSHSAGHRVDVTGADGRITGLVLHNAVGPGIPLVSFAYDHDGHLQQVINSAGRPMAFGYDDDGRLTQWTDRNGAWYRYFYDEHGRCVANQGSGGFLNGTFAYDSAARTTRFVDALGATTVFHYNAANRVVAETDPLGNTTTRHWDEADRLVAVTDALGRTTRYEHNENGQVTATIRPDGSRVELAYDSNGMPVSVVDADGAATLRDYDDRGNLLSVTDPAGAVTRYTYDYLGRVTMITDPLGAVTTVTANDAGLPLAITDPRGQTRRYERDQFGRITSVTDPVGGRTTFGWTVEGKLTLRVRADGATDRWRYDAEGNEVEHIDPMGGVTRTTLTHFDLVAARTDPAGRRSTITYDQNLRVIALEDDLGMSWRFDYDAAGRVVKETDPGGREQLFAYDGAGQLVRRTNGAGQVVSYEYDQLGNRTRTVSAEGVAEFAYDGAGRMVSAVNGDADVRFERDAAGRVLREIVDGDAVVSSYDAAGRRRTRTTPTGSVSEWDYDAGGRHVALRAGGNHTRFVHDGAGREIQRLLDTGTLIEHAFDANHRVTAQTVARDQRTLSHRDFRYRADGALLAITDQAIGSSRFDLDAAGGIVAHTTAQGVARAGHDEAGVPEIRTGPAVTTAGALTYQRDAQGRVVQRRRRRLSAKPDVWHYEWNSDDRLVGLTTPDGSRWRYRYDALGRRVAKELLDGDRVVRSVRYAWDGITLAEQIDSAGQATTWNFAPGTFRPLTQTERRRHDDDDWVDQRFFDIVTDMIGTPVELIDGDGAVAWRNHTTVWGRALGRLASTADTALRFPGQYFDEESGLHYNHQRYYDPEIAQYLSPDPMGAAAGANPFGYAPNPTGASDPLGLALCPRDQIDQYRERYQVGGRRNIAVAQYEINGVSGERIGVSGSHTYPDSAPMPESPRFDRGPDSISRDSDSEWKILEELATQLEPGATGRIHIYSERPVCPSCQTVIEDFRRAFPGIDITYSDYGR
ncbi:RHS repeat-associated core domain-containing protein [Actinokineospora iranica]|uniref:RHS repeat-associated core domain-containing protein n=1 Tax=Actinokineospora iranica TaxID=1271860 RepID=A0A1G6ZHV1_9PSEU|nr:RHS repeat-associated core domain-containing protein [Actinokineospora iranica]SDE01176.1 RHS repeat-associated core domain-containing protein [Actinokineospora iranica]